jgi:hypothetical protein
LAIATNAENAMQSFQSDLKLMPRQKFLIFGNENQCLSVLTFSGEGAAMNAFAFAASLLLSKIENKT